MVQVQGSQKAASVGAAAGVVGGVAAMVIGSTTERVGLAVSGSALLIVSTMILYAHAVLRAIRDTAVERAALIEERELAVAAQAGVAGERERLRGEFDRVRRAAKDLLNRDLAAQRQTLEAEKFAIQRKAVQVGMRMALSGTFDEVPDPPTGLLVPFPSRQLDETEALAASDD